MTIAVEYELSDFTTSEGEVDLSTLHFAVKEAVENSQISQPFVRIDLVGETVFVHFSAELSTPEELALDSIIENHSGLNEVFEPPGTIAKTEEVSSTTTAGMNSTSWIDIPDMTITPKAGKYVVFLRGSLQSDEKDKVVQVALSCDDSIIQSSISRWSRGQRQTVGSFICTAFIEVDGTESVKGSWKVEDDKCDALVFERNLILMKVGD
jgi:hypothetical protein